MTDNNAQRRFKKAARRKAVLAEKRQAERLSASPAAKISRAVGGPIHRCLVHEDLFEAGMGTLIVVRGAPGEMVMCSFLLDVYCLGIKDAYMRPTTFDDMEYLIYRMDDAAPLKPVEPAHARKLLRELAAWSESIGFSPARDFALTERIFGDVSADDCDVTFRFGRDGKPCYVPGPSDTPSQIRRHIERLRENVGESRFDFMADPDETPLVALPDPAADGNEPAKQSA